MCNVFLPERFCGFFSVFRFPLRRALYVPFLRQNPFVAQILSIDGIANIKEAAAVTAWSVIETALLIIKHMEAKQNEAKALRSYTCKAVTEHFFRQGLTELSSFFGRRILLVSDFIGNGVELKNFVELLILVLRSSLWARRSCNMLYTGYMYILRAHDEDLNTRIKFD